MKKIYMQPQLKVTNIQPTSSMMIVVSYMDVYSPSSNTIKESGQILVKKNYTDYNVWDEDWSN